MTSPALATSFDVGGYVASEQCWAVLPKAWKADGTVRPVIYCHGAGADAWATSPYLPAQNGQQAIIQALAGAGYPVLICDLGGMDTWGYIPTTARITSALAYAGSRFGAKTDKCVLVGTSMGPLSAFVWAAANLTKVACLVGVGPISDLQDVVTNNRGGFAATINGVYPGGYSDGTYGATYNPKVIAAAAGFGSMPTQLWYGASDTIVIPSTVTALAASIGASASATSLAGGHAESTWAEVDTATLVAFVKAHA